MPNVNARSATIATVMLASATAGYAACMSAQEPVTESQEALQRSIVAELAGVGADGDGGLGPRSTPQERAAAVECLEERMHALGLTPIRHAYRARNINGLVDLLMSPHRGTNLYAEIRADAVGPNAPEPPWVIVGAHYDTVPGSPGAIDNASGVALVLGLAARVARHAPRRVNYLFVLFDQEEDDEVGSRALVDHIRERGLRVHSVHVTDLVGWDEDGDRAVEVQSPGPMLERAYRLSAARLGVPLQITRGASSDNKSFLAAGYPTAGVWEEWDNDDSTPYLHTPGDTYNTVDFGFLDSTTQLVFDVITRLEVPDDT